MAQKKSLVNREFAKQMTAQNLFENEGKTQKEIAANIGVSEKTLGIWVMKFKWVKRDELAEKRKQAKQLVLKHGLTQKEAAASVGVSEKTIGKWAKKFKWKGTSRKREASEIDTFISGFKLHVSVNYPKKSNSIHALIEEFLKSL